MCSECAWPLIHILVVQPSNWCCSRSCALRSSSLRRLSFSPSTRIAVLKVVPVLVHSAEGNLREREREAGMEREKQADRQTEKETETHRETHRETERGSREGGRKR